MRRTRSVLTLLLAAAALLAPGGATAATAGEPANRGWSSPVGAVAEFANR